MGNETHNLRDKFETVYRPLAKEFFERLRSLPLSREALRAVPCLFLPCYGKFYENHLVKIACMGESTLGWGNDLHDNPWDAGLWDNLWVDLVAWEGRGYDLMFGNGNFQTKGPSKWKNPFWKNQAAALDNLYHSIDALGQDSGHSFFSSVAWGNCLPIEPYRSREVNKKAISKGQHNTISNLSWKLRISGMEHFIQVFAPDVIIYTCRNNYCSDAIFPEDVSWLEDIPYNKEGCSPKAVIKVWKCKGTLIFQTQHPSWLRRQGIGRAVFGPAVAAAMRKHGCFPALPAPGNGKIHYNEANITPDIRTFFVRMLNRRAREYSCGVSQESMGGDFLKELSYRLMLALALELGRQNATMTAALMCDLLNDVELFPENWRYSTDNRGPCATVAGCYRRFGQQHEIYARAIATAFTKKNGDYAYC